MKKVFLSVLLLLASTIILQAQEYYYYYKGGKISLEVDPSTIALMVEDNDGVTPETIKATLLKDSRETITIQEDNTRRLVKPMDEQARQRVNLKTYYVEIKTTQLRSRGEYDQQLLLYRNMPAVSMASPCFKNSNGSVTGLSHQLYIKLKQEQDITVLYEKAEQLGLEVIGRNSFMPAWFTLACNKTTRVNAMQAANELYETSYFEYAEPELIIRVADTPLDIRNPTVENPSVINTVNDPYYIEQWGLKNTGVLNIATKLVGRAGIDIKAEPAWGITKGEGIILAIFDRGYEMDHPDLLANNYGVGYDVHTGQQAIVRGEHGTLVAGVAGAVQNNGEGISGIAPNVHLMSVSGNLGIGVSIQELANGFNWAWQNGADVINCSWFVQSPFNILDDAIALTLHEGRNKKGTVIVFATGNSGVVQYPATIPDVLAVGAISPCGARISHSDPCSDYTFLWDSAYGDELDVVAPGVWIMTTDQQGESGSILSDYGAIDGTSAAAPFVSGVAALILSIRPDLKAKQVNYIIEKTAQKVRTDLYTYAINPGRPNGTWHEEMGYGLVDAYAAVLLAENIVSTLCYQHLFVDWDVVSGVETQQASDKILLSNTIYNNAKAIYQAGNAIEFIPGFEAVYGSVVNARIQSCAGSNAQQNIVEAAGELSRNQNTFSEEQRIKDDETARQFLHVSPNPFTQDITLQYTLLVPQLVNVSIVDITGQTYLSPITNKQVEGGEHTLTIETSALIPGIYSLLFTTNTGTEVRRIIKQ